MRKGSVLTVLVAIILVTSIIMMGCGESATTTAPAATTQAPPVTTTVAAQPSTTAAPAATTTAPAAGKVYNLKFAYHTPVKASLVGAYLTPWTAAIEKATNGQVKITHYGGETLIKEADEYDGLLSGLCDMALIDTSETPGRLPTTEFDTLPYIFPDAATGAKIEWDILQKYSASDLKDVKVIAIAVIAPSNYIGNKPVQNVADFKGLRIRAAGKTEGWTVEALGATPTDISTADLGTSLERGLADGAFLSYSFMLSMGIKDVTKYRTECNLFYRAWPIMVNKKVWDSIPSDLQNAIMSVSGPTNSAAYSAANEKEAAGAKNAIMGSDKGAGKGPIYVLTADQAASWKTALLPVWDRWANDLESKKLPGKAMINDIKTLTQTYSTK
jgi:TRAP-type transport system periplasmic protein